MGITEAELRELTEIAGSAVRIAGAELHARFYSDVEVLDEAGRDIKIREDLVSDELITKELSERSGLPILSEEAVSARGGATSEGLRWIVDPLDGSFNYARRIPLCCVSVGLWDDESPLAGVIFDFLEDECFEGRVGGGLKLNGVRVGMRRWTTKSDAVLATGFPVARDYSAESLRGFVAQVQEFKKIRMVGSAALSLAWVASGRLDAYFEAGARFWDVAGGISLVSAARGQYHLENHGDYIVTLYAGAGEFAL